MLTNVDFSQAKIHTKINKQTALKKRRKRMEILNEPHRNVKHFPAPKYSNTKQH